MCIRLITQQCSLICLFTLNMKFDPFLPGDWISYCHCCMQKDVHIHMHRRMRALHTHMHIPPPLRGQYMKHPPPKSPGLINFVPLTVKPLGIYNPTPPLPCGQMSHPLPCALEVTYMVPTMPLWALSSSGAPSVPCPGPGPRCVLQALLPSLWPALLSWPPFCPQHCW